MSDDLDDLLENANSGRKEDFLHNVSSQLPNELDSLIGGVGDQGKHTTNSADTLALSLSHMTRYPFAMLIVD